MIVIYNNLDSQYEEYDDPIDDAWFWDSPQAIDDDEPGPYPIECKSYESGSVVATDFLWSNGTVDTEFHHYPDPPAECDPELPF